MKDSWLESLGAGFMETFIHASLRVTQCGGGDFYFMSFVAVMILHRKMGMRESEHGKNSTSRSRRLILDSPFPGCAVTPPHVCRNPQAFTPLSWQMTPWLRVSSGTSGPGSISKLLEFMASWICYKNGIYSTYLSAVCSQEAGAGIWKGWWWCGCKVMVLAPYCMGVHILMVQDSHSLSATETSWHPVKGRGFLFDVTWES